MTMTTGDVFSWTLASLSNVTWLFVIGPQLYKNYKLKSSNSISFSLVFCWIVGELLSMISAWGKGLSNVIIFIGMYHLVINVIFMAEILYYRKTNNIFESITVIEEENEPLVTPIRNVKSNNFLNLKKEEMLMLFFTSIIMIILICGMSVSYMDFTNMIAWLSTLTFIVSKIPQIILNRKLKNVEGLSKITFVCIILSNLFFLLSILIKLPFLENSKHSFYFLNNLQWIIGTIISTIMDIILMGQIIYYKKKNRVNVI